jgi:hypothetical protein
MVGSLRFLAPLIVFPFMKDHGCFCYFKRVRVGSTAEAYVLKTGPFPILALHRTRLHRIYYDNGRDCKGDADNLSVLSTLSSN